MRSVIKDTPTLLMATVSGLLLTLAFPSPGLSALAWIGFIPLMYRIFSLSGKRAFIAGYIAGFIHFITLLYWVIPTLNIYGYLPIVLCIPILVLLCAYMALYMAVFTWALQKYRQSVLLFGMAAPATWVALEFIRAKALSGFPWELLGYSQHNVLEIIQLADITGVYGISALLILINACLCLVIRHFVCHKSLAFPKSLTGLILLTVITLGAAYTYGKIRLNDYAVAPVRQISATVIQGNIDQDQKWDPTFQAESTLKYIQLTQFAASQGDSPPDIIIWPETATPFYYLHNKKLTALVRKGIAQTGSYHIIGTPSYLKKGKDFTLFNSARLIAPDGDAVDKYDKVHLVPFGEYVPLQRFIPFIETLAAQAGNFSAGTTGVTLNTPDLKAGVQICFEVIFPELSRKMVLNGADIIVNMTNDAWFGRGSAPYQHFSMVKFRAIENRRSVARAANTGISGFIAPDGSVIAATSLFETKTLTKMIPVNQELTFYTRYGDIFAFGCFGILMASVFFTWKQKEFEK